MPGICCTPRKPAWTACTERWRISIRRRCQLRKKRPYAARERTDPGGIRGRHLRRHKRDGRADALLRLVVYRARSCRELATIAQDIRLHMLEFALCHCDLVGQGAGDTL